MSLGKKLAHCTDEAFEMLVLPVIIEFGSQNRSVEFPLTCVAGAKSTAEMVDKFTATRPPCWLPVMLEPLRLAWESLVTKTPWPWLPDTTKLA